MTAPHQPKRRDGFIDILRGISMIAVVSIHAMANYLGDRMVLHLWDLQQFAVQVFVFCSAYLFFGKPAIPHLSGLAAYLGKRIWRLYLPFLVFAAVYFTLVAVLNPAKFSFDAIWRTLLLINGIDISWLVLLFIQLMFSFLLLSYLRQQFASLFRLYAALIILSSVLLFFVPFPYHWKWIMWLPWSAMGLFALWYHRFSRNRPVMLATYLIATALFFVCIGLEWMDKRIFTIYPNKYPPNVLLMLYGIVWIGIFDALHRGKVFERVLPAIHFFSVNSYPLFFVHYLTIYVMNAAFGLQKILPWWGYWVALFAVAVQIQLGMNQVFSMLKKAKPA